MGKFSPEYMERIHRNSISIGLLKAAIKNNTILESRVVKCSSDNELTLDIGDGIIGIIPFNEVEYKPDHSEIKKAAVTSKINKHVKYIPLLMKENSDGTIVVQCSRRLVQKMCYESYISNLRPGDVIDATVTKVVNYGIFCDIGCGIIALLPTNNISVTHIVNPVEELKDLYKLKVVVKSITSDYRVELTHKELLGTWEEEAAKISEGDLLCGTVLSVESYGVFIRISQNLSGLAELDESRGITLKTGDVVSVNVLSIQSKNMKVKLGILSKLEDQQPMPLTFRYTTDITHISKWVYNTETAKKRIESIFDEEIESENT